MVSKHNQTISLAQRKLRELRSQILVFAGLVGLRELYEDEHLYLQQAYLRLDSLEQSLKEYSKQANAQMGDPNQDLLHKERDFFEKENDMLNNENSSNSSKEEQSLKEINQQQVNRYNENQLFVNNIYEGMMIPEKKILPPVFQEIYKDHGLQIFVCNILQNDSVFDNNLEPEEEDYQFNAQRNEFINEYPHLQNYLMFDRDPLARWSNPD